MKITSFQGEALDKIKKKTAQDLMDEMGEEGFKLFAEATNHPGECRCEACQYWWKMMGPEE